MSTPQIRIIVNGEDRHAPAGTVATLLEHFELPHQRVAVELNQRILPRSAYGKSPLADGDRIEIVQFVGGG